MIKNLKIKNMFGWRNYNIDFKDDLTLLVGANGSGKTSILNIISSIASKNLDFLSKYNFEEVTLSYVVGKELQEVNIKMNSEGLYELKWKDFLVPINLNNIDETYIRLSAREDSRQTLDAILTEISNELNILYLPLSRDNRFLEGNNEDNIVKYTKQGTRYITTWSDGDTRPTGGIDDTLRSINKIVKEYQRKTGIRLEQLNERMRKEIFQSSFKYYENEALTSDIKMQIGILNDTKINELKNAFKEMKLLSPQFEKEMDMFIARLFAGYEVFSKWQAGEKEYDNSILSFIGNLPQLNRIMQWQKVIQDINQKKEELQRNMKTFLDTVNDFLKESNKELVLNDRDGNVLFTQENSKKRMELDKLSSGEKQIVIFFAYLIFEVSSKQKGIYIIDEPELSLHIAWQRNFAKSILNISSNLQLIFATHSPEIVGVFRNKCVSLRSDR
ncbi:AAA family ATPase [Paenibacillus sp. sgz5001063]|uniref:AAA family ATPase n=1 Tax=Paenibacillus sp. sgz5001063 TaxID=3242474 RepID=UPI0036D243B9